ncbi:ATP-binding protein [Herbaspirillum huttiense]|uniref:HD domain-containing protein n=1 Tax=Herbaspirillum huttiense TaxID=863372 RepID=UPI002176E867|nr:ATP-binding protein [Herbaspirillum huttiense]UWE15668.1 ATP-binding protein [Herbaspirillum huttiense]
MTHLDALWHVADKLLGEKFEINPAEAYVLGMAFLLHDAATSSYAYPNGIAELRETVEWKDYVTQQGFAENQLCQGEPQYQQVLFETLRLLHANRAENLLTQNWQDLNGETRYLLEDVELRNHYGKIIGKIAASHSWDASVVEQEWASASLIAPHSSLGLDAAANWVVDRLKLAMLLRCIDAAHIDSLRAPDIPLMLNAPAGESRRHWTFQNKLSSVAVNVKGEIYWSSSAFDVTQSDAWWRCYETCQMIDREIRTANRILSDHGRRIMVATGVMGANDIEVFQKNVPVEGWHPFNFNFQVSQVGSVIEKFGGERLYGDDPTIALRELIQNAADAIRARRFQIGNQAHGQITVSLRNNPDGSLWLDVTDDGLGMSRYVLTEVLLDFGRSLWKDSSLRDQWRGLASKGFTPVGKYGIGFFSVFMLGDEVKVTTWRYGSAITDQITLHLRNRVIERPILLQATQEELLTGNGTRVSVKLRDGRKTLLKEPPQRFLAERKVSPRLDELVAHLAPTLDIDVWCQDDLASPIQAIKANDWETLDPNALLSRLRVNMSTDVLKRYAMKLRPMIDSDGKIVGRAALLSDRSSWFKGDGSGALVHRGLRAGTCDGIVGYIQAENSIDLARHNAVPIVSGPTLRQWAEEQVSANRNAVPPLTEKIVSLDCGDAGSVVGRIDGQLVTILDLVERFRSGEIHELICFEGEVECPNDMSRSEFDNFEYLDTLLDLTQAECSSRFDFGMKDWIEQVIPAAIGRPKTITGLLEHHLRAEFDDLNVYSESRVVGTANLVSFTEECLIFERSKSAPQVIWGT